MSKPLERPARTVGMPAAEARAPAAVPREEKVAYLESLTLIERLHRRLLDVIKAELDASGREDLNSVQALLVYNVGEKELTAGELRTRGYYLGSNVSYNLKKLVEAGYLDQQRSAHDRRSVRIRITDRGREVCRLLDELYDRHIREFPTDDTLASAHLDEMNVVLRTLEAFWSSQIRF